MLGRTQLGLKAPTLAADAAGFVEQNQIHSVAPFADQVHSGQFYFILGFWDIGQLDAAYEICGIAALRRYSRQDCQSVVRSEILLQRNAHNIAGLQPKAEVQAGGNGLYLAVHRFIGF